MTLLRIEYGPASSVDHLIMAQAYMMVLAGQIKANGHDVPTQLTNDIDQCTRDLNYKLRGDRLRQVEALKLRREQLLTADEKRKNLEAEIARIEELLK